MKGFLSLGFPLALCASAFQPPQELPVQTRKMVWPLDGCDKIAAAKTLERMKPHQVESIVVKDDLVIVTFGFQYVRWDNGLTGVMISTVIDIDTCISGLARKFEFRTPSGKVITRVAVFRDKESMK